MLPPSGTKLIVSKIVVSFQDRSDGRLQGWSSLQLQQTGRTAAVLALQAAVPAGLNLL